MEDVLVATRRRQAVVVPKATLVITTEETNVIEVIKAVVPSAATRPIVIIGGAVISIPTAGVYENDAHGLGAWYQDIYESAGGQSYAFSVGTGRGEGHGGGGRGFGPGRGRGRGRGGFQGRGGFRVRGGFQVRGRGYSNDNTGGRGQGYYYGNQGSYYGGPSQGSYYQGNGDGNNYYVYPPSVQPGQQASATGTSFHNAPVPGTVTIPMQMPPSTAPGPRTTGKWRQLRSPWWSEFSWNGQ